ncbi:MAG: TetR/AcrR family transcriptional regulator [Elusimicrobia bacterium]|nr:TetR/AcrR family transcriptional regulator [Elusimicrobiota bacterium]
MNGRGARERILAAATRLFYAHGVNSVGVDRIVAEAEVTKTSLYRHFPSKEILVVAFLGRINREWSAWLKERVEGASVQPRARLLAVFDALGEWFRTPTFRGCPFINTSAEISNRSNPAAKAASAFKTGFRDYLRALSDEAKVRDPGLLADQLLLLADGAIVRAAMTGDVRSASAAKKAAGSLIRQSRQRPSSESPG